VLGQINTDLSERLLLRLQGLPSRWRQDVTPKRRFLSFGLYAVTFQKTAIFIVAVRTPNEALSQMLLLMGEGE
jgi:hypothetical protein